MKTALLVAAACLGLATPAFAESVKVGQLRCDVSAGVGMIIASSKAMECVFDSARGRHETYHGFIKRLGFDIGATGPGMLTWEVFAPTAGRLRHALAGDYSGVGASATVGVGLGANALVGGSNREVSLQPLSLQTQNGLNVAGGISELELRAGR